MLYNLEELQREIKPKEMNNRQKIKSTEFISANSLGSTIFKLNTDLLKQQIKKQNKEAKLRSKIKKQILS